MRRNEDDLEWSNPFNLHAPTSAPEAGSDGDGAGGAGCEQAKPEASGGVCGDGASRESSVGAAAAGVLPASHKQQQQEEEQDRAFTAGEQVLFGFGDGSVANAGDVQDGTAPSANSGEAGGHDGSHNGQLRSRLAEIDALLEQYSASHFWDQSGSLADFQGIFSDHEASRGRPRLSATQGALPPSPRILRTATGGPAPPPQRQSSCGTRCSSGKAGTCEGRDPRADGSSRRGSTCGDGATDYLRLAREQRELEDRWGREPVEAASRVLHSAASGSVWLHVGAKGCRNGQVLSQTHAEGCGRVASCSSSKLYSTQTANVVLHLRLMPLLGFD